MEQIIKTSYLFFKKGSGANQTFEKSCGTVPCGGSRARLYGICRAVVLVGIVKLRRYGQCPSEYAERRDAVDGQFVAFGEQELLHRQHGKNIKGNYGDFSRRKHA